MTHQRRSSLRWAAAGVAVAVLAGLGGWLVADRVVGDRDGERSGSKLVSAGPARLTVPARWQPARRPPALPGLPGAATWRLAGGRPETVSAALVPADHPALVPARLIEQADGGLPPAQKARVAGLDARAYLGVIAAGTILDVYAIPTTRGVVTLVCAGGVVEAPTPCLDGLARISVPGAQPIVLEPVTAYRMHAPATLARLDAIRVRERAALHRAGSPAEQARAAAALWSAYDAAADELAPLAPSGQPAAFVVVALRDAARAYRALGMAADRQSTRAWASARTAVRDAELELERELAVA